jgi:type VI secretion system protein
MPLLLRIDGPADNETGTLIEVDTVLQIGRGADNGLVLPDEDRLLSKTHCVIELQAGRYVLTDSSTNGTFLNDKRERLAPGIAVPLAVGDIVRLGQFKLSVASIIMRHQGGNPGTTPLTELLGPVSNAPVRPPPPSISHAPSETDSLLGSIRPPPGSSVDEFLTDAAGDAWRPALPVAAAQSDHSAANADSFDNVVPRKEGIPADWNPISQLGRTESKAPPPQEFPPTPPPSPAPTAASPEPTSREQSESSHAVDRFLAALGQDASKLSGDQAVRVVERAARALHIAVDGILNILGSRGATKQAFGIERTVITRGANNPLKFASTTEEALHLLLSSDLTGFLPAEDAMRQAVADIQSHQLALLSGVKSAFADTLRRLDPASIEAALPHHASDTLLPQMRKARAWDAFRGRFAELERSLDDDRGDAFGTAFARAYAAAQQATRQPPAGAPKDRPDDI